MVLLITLSLVAFLAQLPTSCSGQANGGTYDFGYGRSGEKRGEWSPTDWLAATLLLMTLIAGLAVTAGLCYYVSKRESRVTYSKAPSLVVHL